jgi:uncharacterized integral membrane protein
MIRFIIGIVVGVLVIVFIVQNIETVDIDLYFWTVSANRAVMFLIVFIAGCIVGWLTTGIRRIRKRSDRKK